MGRLFAIEEAFEFVDRESDGCRPTMGAGGGSFGGVAERDDVRELGLAEFVPRFDRGFARHHVEDLVQRFFLGRDEALALDALEEFVEECAGIDIAGEEEGWDAGNSYGSGAHRRGADPDAFKEFLEIVELVDDRGGNLDDDRGEESLLFEDS